METGGEIEETVRDPVVGEVNHVKTLGCVENLSFVFSSLEMRVSL